MLSGKVHAVCRKPDAAGFIETAVARQKKTRREAGQDARERISKTYPGSTGRLTLKPGAWAP